MQKIQLNMRPKTHYVRPLVWMLTGVDHKYTDNLGNKVHTLYPDNPDSKFVEISCI